MTCDAVREHVLQSDRPDQPASGDARHLIGCPACRGWHYRLVRLERQLARLPAPASGPPQELLAMFQDGRVLVRAPRSGPHPAARAREFGRRKLAFAASLAAALALFALGLWAIPQRPGLMPPAPSAMAELIEKDRKLAAAPNLQARLFVLTERAEEALAEAGDHLDDAARVGRQADRFDRLVKDALLRHAHELPADIRAGVLHQLASRMRDAESRASRLVAAASQRQAGSAAALTRMASTARAADLRLRELARRA